MNADSKLRLYLYGKLGLAQCYLGLRAVLILLFTLRRFSETCIVLTLEPHFSRRSALRPDTETSFGGNNHNIQSCNMG